MNTIKALFCLMIIACAGQVRAEFMELTASKIATVASEVKSAPPMILVQWEFPEDMVDWIIDGAVISMDLPTDSACEGEVELYQSGKSWDVQELTTQEDLMAGAPLYDEDRTFHSIVGGATGKEVNADVHAAIRQQVSGQTPNFGFVVVPKCETPDLIKLIEANDAEALTHAKLIIAYRKRR